MKPYPTGVELGELMLRFRAEHGLSVTEMASRAKIGVATWRRLEGGEGNARIDTRARIYGVIGYVHNQDGRELVTAVVQATRQTRKKGTPMANRHDLSTGLIKCTITTEVPLPSPAYAVLAGLVEVLERTNQQLEELLRED